MLAVFRLLVLTLRSCVRSRAGLQLEVLALRHQLHVLGNDPNVVAPAVAFDCTPFPTKDVELFEHMPKGSLTTGHDELDVVVAYKRIEIGRLDSGVPHLGRLNSSSLEESFGHEVGTFVIVLVQQQGPRTGLGHRRNA